MFCEIWLLPSSPAASRTGTCTLRGACWDFSSGPVPSPTPLALIPMLRKLGSTRTLGQSSPPAALQTPPPGSPRAHPPLKVQLSLKPGRGGREGSRSVLNHGQGGEGPKPRDLGRCILCEHSHPPLGSLKPRGGEPASKGGVQLAPGVPTSAPVPSPTQI